MGIQEIILQLLIKQPFYGYVAATVTPQETQTVKKIKMAAVPSLKLLYNPNWFAGLQEQQQIGVVIHELMHLILLHPFRRGERDLALWSIACDLAVNEHIDPQLLTEDAITVRSLAHKLKLQLPGLKSAEFYYEVISVQEEMVFLVGKNEEVTLAMDSDHQLTANLLADEPIAEADKKALMSNLAQTMEEAKAEGELLAGLQGFVDEVYQDYKVNWRNILKRFLSGRGRIMVRKSYKRQSRRFENLPGTKRSIGVKALVAIDESGSISNSLITRFYNELKSINRITGASIMVTRFDTECTPPVPLKEYVKSKDRLKSGGTDFRPIFKVADQLKIPLLIIFTDGDGTAPDSANQKTLWVLAQGGKRPAPFGHYLEFTD